MNIYKLVLTDKFNAFDKLCEQVNLLGKYMISPQGIVLISNIEAKDLIKKLDKIDFAKNSLFLSEIENYTKEIENETIRKWIAQEIYNQAREELENEMQDRIVAMHDILVNANKILQKGDE